MWPWRRWWRRLKLGLSATCILMVRLQSAHLAEPRAGKMLFAWPQNRLGLHHSVLGNSLNGVGCGKTEKVAVWQSGDSSTGAGRSTALRGQRWWGLPSGGDPRWSGKEARGRAPPS